MGASINSLEWPIFFRRPTFLFFFLSLLPSAGFFSLSTTKHVGVCDFYPGPEGEGKFVSTCCWRKGEVDVKPRDEAPARSVSPPPRGSPRNGTELKNVRFCFYNLIGARCRQWHNNPVCGGTGAAIRERRWMRALTRMSGRDRLNLPNSFRPCLKRTLRTCFCAAAMPPYFDMCPTSEHATLLLRHGRARTVVLVGEMRMW